ncbi:MAG: potassium channel protein [Paludibacter sp.]|nr:potassium channel protein [Paludibacter sp.]
MLKSNFRHIVFRKLLLPSLALILLVVVSFWGYILIEGYTPLESLYMIVITFATIGYGEVKPLSDTGREFTMVIILAGFSLGLYAVSQISTFFIDGELSKLLKLRRMNKALSNLNEHYIICGYGKTGRKVVEDLLAKKQKVVLIEGNPERVEKLKDFYDENLIHLVGDATSDEVLMQAGVDRAKYLIAVLNSDAENLFVTLSAKDYNKKIKVITRVEETNSTGKFKKAGADFIISPIEIASERIVSIVTTGQDYYNFLEFTEGKPEFHDYKFGLVLINEQSDLIGKTYREANIPQRTHLVVIGYYSANDELQVNPKADNKINFGDRLLVFGKDDEINLLKDLAYNH